jgi:hypothetical protein
MGARAFLTRRRKLGDEPIATTRYRFNEVAPVAALAEHSAQSRDVLREIVLLDTANNGRDEPVAWHA